MLRYYLWGLGEKTLSYVPLGKRFYKTVGLIAKRNTCGNRPTFASSLRLARKAKDYMVPGAVAMEVGTGWYHHDAFLLYLISDNTTVYLFDIEDQGRVRYIHNYLRNLLAHADRLDDELGVDSDRTREKLEPLLQLDSREAIYERCGFVPMITADTDTPWLEEQSIDFMVYNCVLNHIPPAILEPELDSLKRMLKPDGAMHHLLGHDDHWAFHDSKANMFQYYRYSDRYYRWFFETKLEYQNRMVKGEWLALFDRVGLDVLDYYEHVTDESRKAITEIPIDERYRRWPLDDLAIVYSYVLLGPRPAGSPDRAAVAARSAGQES